MPGAQVNIIDEYNTRDEIAKEEGKPIADVPDSRIGAAVIFCKYASKNIGLTSFDRLNGPRLLAGL